MTYARIKKQTSKRYDTTYTSHRIVTCDKSGSSTLIGKGIGWI